MNNNNGDRVMSISDKVKNKSPTTRQTVTYLPESESVSEEYQLLLSPLSVYMVKEI